MASGSLGCPSLLPFGSCLRCVATATACRVVAFFRRLIELSRELQHQFLAEQVLAALVSSKHCLARCRYSLALSACMVRFPLHSKRARRT
jgi:hypothetical protein